jgi:hypothetical protein
MEGECELSFFIRHGLGGVGIYFWGAKKPTI